jgi:two-component system, sensor histidine kinase
VAEWPQGNRLARHNPHIIADFWKGRAVRPFRPSLQLVILGPAIGLMLLAGLILYLLVLRTVGNYADENIRATLDSLLQNAVTIADSEVDRQNRESRIADSDAALDYQLNARIRFEDFARDQGVGLIVAADGALDFVTGISQDEAEAIFETKTGPGTHQVQSKTGGSYYTTTASFTPWNWRILLIKDAADFNALVRQVQLIYGGSALALLATAGLLVFGLRQLMVRPIYQIAAEFSRGHAPAYKGVKELEHLSDSIGAMLRSLGAKTLHLETTLQSMSDAITVYDADLRLVAWNPQYLRLAGFPETLIRHGVHFSDLMRYNVDRGDYGPGDPERQMDGIMERARTLNPPRFEVDRADGTSFEVRRAPMPDGGFVTTYTDITDRRQSARSEAANIAKSRFLENMSHDLRKPIAAVIEDCQLLLIGGGSGLKKSERTIVENVRDNTSHLLGMVDELLEMSRIEAGQVEVKPMVVAVPAAVTQALRVIEPVAKAKGLILKTDMEGELEARTDGQLLARILMNLLGNAVEYTSKGSIIVSARRRGSNLEVKVADTGSGIPTDSLGLIFEKFQRVQSTAGITRPGIGLGLGLAISREFAHLLGGDIRVESEVGKGSIFTLTIPAE